MNKAKRSFLKQRLYLSFTSPVFYVAAVIFTVFCAFQFFFMQNFFGGNGTTDLHYFFSAIPYISILIIPALCIRTGGSWEDTLPFTSAFSTIAYWTGVFAQFCAMLLPLAAVPLCVNLFGDVDAGAAAASFLLVILYAAAAVSCAVFFFSAIPSNTLAFVFSALVLAVTNSIHLVSRFAATSSVLMRFVQAASFSWHFDRAAKGILDSRDIFYFIAAALLFFLLTVLVREKRAGKTYSKQERTQIFLAALIFVFASLNSGAYSFRLDLTASQKFTASPYIKKLLSAAESSVRITYYRSSVLSSLYPQTRDVYDFLTELAADKNVSVCAVSPEKDSSSAAALEYYGIASQQIQTAGNNRTEFINVYSAIVIEYEGAWEVIPFILSCDTLEYDIAGRLEHLITGKKRYVTVLCGNGLSLKSDYSYVIPWLSAQGFICNEIDISAGRLSYQLEQSRNYGNLLLVLGSGALSDDDCMAIETYLESGGRVLFAVSPYEADIENSWHITKSRNQRLITLLSAFGTEFSPDIICDLSCARITMESYENADGSAASSAHSAQLNYFQWVQLLPQENARQGITLFWPVEVRSFQENAVNLLFTSSSSHEMHPDTNSSDSLFETNPFILSNAGYNPQKAVQKMRPVGVHVSDSVYGFYNAGIFDNVEYEVITDQYFVHSLMLGYIGGAYGDYRNLDFLVNRLLRLNGEEELAVLQDSGASSAKNQFLYKVTDAESFRSARNQTIFCTFILNPLLIIAAGIASYILRKNKIRQYAGCYEK